MYGDRQMPVSGPYDVNAVLRSEPDAFEHLQPGGTVARGSESDHIPVP
jgi:hypothetical protein